MSGYPFDPERLAALGNLAASINGDRAPEPIADPVLIDDVGRALVPVPGTDGFVWVTINAGVLLQWAVTRAPNGALLSLWGGPPDEIDDATDGLVAFMTPIGLRGFANELLAIAARIEGDT